MAYTSLSGIGTTTLLLACPTDLLPRPSCTSTAINGDTVYHTRSSVFGGTLPGATSTTFYCDLWSGSYDMITGQYEESTITAGLQAVMEVLDTMYVTKHQAKMFITGGLKLAQTTTQTAVGCTTTRRGLFLFPVIASGMENDPWEYETCVCVVVDNAASSGSVTSARV
ncbi:hypothetical protein BJ878DRAFT_541021 [Calycina marina]|uniref:Uncharacterized protein n=1 Tax=Calycina marina TaxID=1763456 RepID=A0A9P7Z4Z3_9HELO|nr:hypothetical protein BJ878DRAFT_541021 [Calycina marina]